MAFLNHNYLKLKAGCLFPEIGRRVKFFLRSESRSGQANLNPPASVGQPSSGKFNWYFNWRKSTHFETLVQNTCYGKLNEQRETQR
jgi:hypothetical protein